MATVAVHRGRAEEARLVAAASAGDETAARTLFEAYRRELHVHCYRLLGSFHDAEDLVQETFLRAFRRLAGFEGRSSLRAWLYRIATNACLDALERRPRRILPADLATPADPAADVAPAAEIAWLEPYPDSLLDELEAADGDPYRRAVSRETIEIAFLAAIQRLTPRQRAALVLRDVLGWSSAEVAAALGSSVAAANSALQRARETLRLRLPDGPPDAASASEAERDLVARYVAAWEAADVARLAALLAEDATLAMPPTPSWYAGRAAVAAFLAEHVFGPRALGRYLLAPAAANRQPALAVLLEPAGGGRPQPLAIKTVRVRDGAIAEIVGFTDPAILAAFGLAPAAGAV
jgi:RNA polymerase sigma-70 factor (ECF subfamily)